MQLFLPGLVCFPGIDSFRINKFCENETVLPPVKNQLLEIFDRLEVYIHPAKTCHLLKVVVSSVTHLS